ncbi:MAG: hypothetical protein JWR16_1849 [Nevskia sp.]|nr:hypothetical protein [Nevskia sp.]
MSATSRLRLSAERFALIFTQPFKTVQRRINRWIATRTPRIAGPWVVNRRRVYILPTRYGYGYALLLLVMLLGAMNYSNSMAFALTFLLAGLGLIGMHHTHGNLVNVEVRQTRVAPVFAGEAACFIVELANPSLAPRYALCAAWQEDEPSAQTIAPASIDLGARHHATLTLTQPAMQRGWLPAPRFAVSTEFPLGLFYAWTWVELDMRCLVYPRAAARGTRAPDSAGGQGSRNGLRSGQEDFAGLRNYQRGDAPRSIHWKSFPKQRIPMVKQFSETLEDELWLDWAELPAPWDVERRLSQLTRWVLDADANGRAFGLRMPTAIYPPATGAAHRHECLQALALFEAR